MAVYMQIVTNSLEVSQALNCCLIIHYNRISNSVCVVYHALQVKRLIASAVISCLRATRARRRVEVRAAKERLNGCIDADQITGGDDIVN